jgi:hypothetical protein
MERKEETEIGPEPVADPETEKFEEATEDQGLADRRRSSSSRDMRQAMYRKLLA